MDLDIKTLALIANSLINFAIGAWLYLDRKADKTNALIAQLTARVEEQAGRIAHLEAHAEDAPTHGDLGEIYKRIDSVNSEVSTVNAAVSKINGTLESVNASLRALTSELMKRGLGVQS
jgi:chromosome segregation ATPase